MDLDMGAGREFDASSPFDPSPERRRATATSPRKVSGFAQCDLLTEDMVPFHSQQAKAHFGETFAEKTPGLRRNPRRAVRDKGQNGGSTNVCLRMVGSVFVIFSEASLGYIIIHPAPGVILLSVGH